MLGFVVKKLDLIKFISAKSSLLFPLALIASYISIKYNPISLVTLDENRYGNIFPFYLGAIAGIETILWIANRIKKIQKFCFFGKKMHYQLLDLIML